MDVRAKNLEGARKTDRARELYGDRLSWNHGARGTLEEPRPSHVAADGKNFDVRLGPPVETGARPGVLPGCTCAAGPPRRGAHMLLGGGGCSGRGRGGGSAGGGGSGGSGDEGERKRKVLEILMPGGEPIGEPG